MRMERSNSSVETNINSFGRRRAARSWSVHSSIIGGGVVVVVVEEFRNSFNIGT